MKKYSEIYAVDFDGTLHNGKYPEIGEPNEELIEFLKRTQAAGDKVILWSCRCGKKLKKAVKWCEKQGLVFDVINKNTKENIKKFKTDSRKIFANYYVDDRNLKIEEITGKRGKLPTVEERLRRLQEAMEKVKFFGSELDHYNH